MKRNLVPDRGRIHLRSLLALVLCSLGLLLAIAGFIGIPSRPGDVPTAAERYMPIPGGEPDDLNRLELDWHNRLTYPTGRFDPAWVRQAAAGEARILRRVPLGRRSTNLKRINAPLALNSNSFTALGPQPLRMTGCSGCFNYTTAAGRVNDIVIDPVTPNVLVNSAGALAVRASLTSNVHPDEKSMTAPPVSVHVTTRSGRSAPRK